MNDQDIAEIIEKAKTGDKSAKNQVIKLIQDNGYMRMISHYLYINRLLEPDDVQSEFWLGVILALPKVSTSIGNPLSYLAWQGMNRVRGQLRKRITKGVQAQCNECGWTGQLYRKNTEYECRKCGSKDISTWQKEINTSSLLFRLEGDKEKEISDLRLYTATPQLEIDIKLDIEYFKSKLSPGELNVFVLIVEKDVNRYHEKNYLRTIANILQVSPQCISQYLRKIRTKMAKWIEERR